MTILPVSQAIAVIGGGPAGLSAALALSRVHRSVLLFDNKQYRNYPAPAIHSVLGHDGRPNPELRALGRKEILSYGKAQIVEETVESVQAVKREAGGSGTLFDIKTDAGKTYQASKVILATGIKDVLPPIPGAQELWDQELVAHCPYCAGHERRGGTLAALGVSVMSIDKHLLASHLLHDALLLLSNGPIPDQFADATRARAKEVGVEVDERKIARLEKHADGRSIIVHFEDNGATRTVGSILTIPDSTLHPSIRPIVEGLGLSVSNPSPFPRQEAVVAKDDFGRTEVEGVYVTGDLATMMRSGGLAITQGMKAGVAAHDDLVIDEVARRKLGQ